MSYKKSLIYCVRNVYRCPLLRGPVKFLVRRGVIPKKIYKHIPVDAEVLVRVNDGVSFRYISNMYDKVGRCLYWKGVQGGYESEVVAVFMKLVQQSKLFLDLGANSGLYTLLACALNEDAEAIAVEPVPRVFAQLQKNVSLNNWNSRCRLVNRAVSNQTGHTTLFVPFTRNGRISEMAYGASLIPNWEHANVSREEIKIETVTVDQICLPDKMVDLVKMDIEGVEDKVLEGMEDTITRGHPSIIFEARPGSPTERIGDFLAGHGYSLWHLLPSGPHVIDRIPESHDIRRWNFLAAVKPWE